MIFNRKVEIIFDNRAQLILDGQSKICNWLYNHLLEIVKEDYKAKKHESVLLREKGRNLRNLIPIIKKDKTFLESVYSSPLKNVAFRLYNAYEGFFKNGKGYPKFRSNKVSWFSLLYDEPNKGYKLNKNEIRISLGKNKDKKQMHVIGKLKEKLNLREKDKLKNFRLCKEFNKYYGIFCIEREEEKRKQVKSWISLDPNHKNLFVGINSNGESIEFKNPSQPEYFDKVIDQLKSKRDHYQKHSKHWERINRALNYAYHKKREQTKQLCYTISNQLARNYDCVIMGDYTPGLETAVYDSMHRSMLNQSIIGKFRNILSWVMLRSYKSFILVDEHNTTKECCICGHIEKKEPSIREFTCKRCQRHLSRDINSSVNIAKKSKKLSGSDYATWELSHVTYTAKWDYINCTILLSGYANQNVA